MTSQAAQTNTFVRTFIGYGRVKVFFSLLETLERQTPCWPVLVNICVFLVETEARGVAALGAKARKVPLTGARVRWGRTNAEAPWCWGSQQLVPTKSAAVREPQGWAATDKWVNLLIPRSVVQGPAYPATLTYEALRRAPSQLWQQGSRESCILEVWAQVLWLQVTCQNSHPAKNRSKWEIWWETRTLKGIKAWHQHNLFRNATMQDQTCGLEPFLLFISEKRWQKIIKNIKCQSHLSILSLVRFGLLNRVRITWRPLTPSKLVLPRNPTRGVSWWEQRSGENISVQYFLFLRSALTKWHLTCCDVSCWKWLTGRWGSSGRMEVRKYGGQVGTSPTALDCRSLFTKAFFCSNFIPELWSRIAVNLRRSRNAPSSPLTF